MPAEQAGSREAFSAIHQFQASQGKSDTLNETMKLAYARQDEQLQAARDTVRELQNINIISIN